MELLFWLTAFLASLLGTIAAFGISSILLPVALNLFSFETALILVSLFHLFGNISRIGFYRKGIDVKVAVMFGIPALVFTFLGAFLIEEIDLSFLKVIVGIILIIYSSLNLLEYNLEFKPRKFNTIIGGSLYGFLSGLIGTGGPIRGAILSGFGLEKDSYIATNGIISFFIDLTRISVYLSMGFLLPEFYWYIPLLFLVSLLGGFFSRLIVDRISVKEFSMIIQLAIILVSIKLVYDGLSSLF